MVNHPPARQLRPAAERLGECVLLRPEAVAEVARVVQGAVKRHERDGITPPQALRAVLDATRNCAEPRGHATAEPIEFREGPYSAASFPDPITTKEAAAMLSCSPEYVRRLARETDLPARLTAKGWAVSRSAVEAMCSARGDR